LVLRVGDRDRLAAWVRSSTVRAGRRARIVLLAAEGVSNTEIASRLGVSRPTVIGWRDRYGRVGMDGLTDESRPGRPRTVDQRRIITETLKPPP
jgi:transposase